MAMTESSHFHSILQGASVSTVITAMADADMALTADMT